MLGQLIRQDDERQSADKVDQCLWSRDGVHHPGRGRGSLLHEPTTFKKCSLRRQFTPDAVICFFSVKQFINIRIETAFNVPCFIGCEKVSW